MHYLIELDIESASHFVAVLYVILFMLASLINFLFSFVVATSPILGHFIIAFALLKHPRMLNVV